MKAADIKTGVEFYVYYEGKWRIMEVEQRSFGDWWLRYKPTLKSKYYRSTRLQNLPFCSKDELPAARAALKKKMRDAKTKAEADRMARAERRLKYQALCDELIVLGVRALLFNRMSSTGEILAHLECSLDETEARLFIDALKKAKKGPA